MKFAIRLEKDKYIQKLYFKKEHFFVVNILKTRILKQKKIDSYNMTHKMVVSNDL